MSEIPEEVSESALAEARVFADWLRAGNSTGSLSEHGEGIDGYDVTPVWTAMIDEAMNEQ